MTDSESDEDLVGEELIRVGLETYAVHLTFQNTALQFWAEFWVSEQAMAWPLGSKRQIAEATLFRFGT